MDINEIIEKELKEYMITSKEEISFQKRISNIMVSHYKNIYVPNYKKKYLFKDNFQIAYTFLKNINEEYAELLVKRYQEGAFIVDEYVEGSKIAISNIINGKPMIYFPTTNLLRDSYRIVHEFIHDTTINGGYNNTRMIFCEIFSLYSELLMAKYHENQNIKEATIRSREIYSETIAAATKVKVELELMDKYLEKGFINEQDCVSIIKSIPNRRDALAAYYVILKDEKFTFGMDQRYVIGYLLALFMLERDKNNSIEFFELNEMLNSYSIENLLNYLDLELINSAGLLELSEKSYQKLEESYIKQLKKMR